MIVCFSAGQYVVLIFAVSSQMQMQNIPYMHLYVNSKSSSVIKQTTWADSCNLHQTNWQSIHSSIPFCVSFIWFLDKKFFYKIFKLMTEILKYNEMVQHILLYSHEMNSTGQLYNNFCPNESDFFSCWVFFNFSALLFSVTYIIIVKLSTMITRVYVLNMLIVLNMRVSS